MSQHYQANRSAWWSWPLTSLAVLGASGLWVGMAYRMGDVASLVPVMIVVMITGGILLWQVTLGKRWAVIALYVVGTLWLATSVRTRPLGEVGLDWQNGSKFILWCSFLAIGTLSIKRIAPFFLDPVMFCAVLYLGLAFLTVTISEAPFVTVVSVVVVVSYVLFACVIAEALSIRDIMLMMTWSMAAYCLISLLSALVVPDIAFPQTIGFDETASDLTRLQGLSGQPNQLGTISRAFMTFLIGSVYLGYLRRAFWVPMAFMGMGTLIATQSRTAFFALVIGCLSQISRRFLVPIVILIAIIALSIWLSGETTAILRMVGRGGSASEAESMAGRAELWQFTWKLIDARPLFGYGFNSFESYAGTVWTGESWAPIISPHNNYMALLYNTGYLLSLPWIAGYAILLYRWYADPYLPRDLFIIAVLVTGYAEPDLPGNSVVPTLSFFLVVVLDAKRRYMDASLT